MHILVQHCTFRGGKCASSTQSQRGLTVMAKRCQGERSAQVLKALPCKFCRVTLWHERHCAYAPTSAYRGLWRRVRWYQQYSLSVEVTGICQHAADIRQLQLLFEALNFVACRLFCRPVPQAVTLTKMEMISVLLASQQVNYHWPLCQRTSRGTGLANLGVKVPPQPTKIRARLVGNASEYLVTLLSNGRHKAAEGNS